MCYGFNQNYSSLNGLYNVNCDDLLCDTFGFNYLDKIPQNYFDNIRSNIQTQIDNENSQIAIITTKTTELNYNGSTSFFKWCKIQFNK